MQPSVQCSKPGLGMYVVKVRGQGCCGYAGDEQRTECVSKGGKWGVVRGTKAGKPGLWMSLVRWIATHRGL